MGKPKEKCGKIITCLSFSGTKKILFSISATRKRKKGGKYFVLMRSVLSRYSNATGKAVLCALIRLLSLSGGKPQFENNKKIDETIKQQSCQKLPLS